MHTLNKPHRKSDWQSEVRSAEVLFLGSMFRRFMIFSSWIVLLASCEERSLRPFRGVLSKICREVTRKSAETLRTADYADVANENRDLKPRMNQPSQSCDSAETNLHEEGRNHLREIWVHSVNRLLFVNYALHPCYPRNPWLNLF